MTKLRLNSDILYSARDSLLWTILEANVGIICACLPLMRSVLIYLIPWFGDRTSSRRPSRHQTGEGFSTGNPRCNKYQSASKDEALHDKNNALVVSCVEERDSRSLNSSELVIVETQRREDLEAAADSTTEDDESQTESGGRRAT